MGSIPVIYDGQWRLLDFDPVTRIAQWFWYDEDKDQFTIRTVQEVEDILAENRQLEAESNGVRFGDGKKIASIPLCELDRIMPAVVNKDEDYIKKFLNDPDNRKFRTFRGKV